MKIVQSFWSKPFLQADALLTNTLFGGGWPHRTFNYYSCALSCLLLRKFYDNVELVTDRLGKEILIDRMELPYTRVVVALDALEYPPGLWAMGKVHTYGMQTEPFLHIDNDVFLGKPFEADILAAPLAAQNLEARSRGCTIMFKKVFDTFSRVPAYLRPTRELEFTPSANAGLLGGNDLAFFRYYAREVASFIGDNEPGILRMMETDKGMLNVVLEQVFFYALAQHRKTDITYLLPVADTNPAQIGYFHGAEQNKHFVHFLGQYKRDNLAYPFLESNLKKQYPGYYHRINHLIAESEI